MSVPFSVPDRIGLLRSQAQRYKQLAEALYDRRSATEVSLYANELEAEICRLEKWEHSHHGLDSGCVAPVS